MILYYISHFLQVWLLPPGLNLLLGLIGYLLLRHMQRLGEFILLFSFISLWLLCTPFFASLLISKLNHQYSAVQIDSHSTESQPSPGVIIALGGGWEEVSEYKKKYITNKVTLNRLRYAVYLHQQTRLPLLVSGGRLIDMSTHDDTERHTEAELMMNDLTEFFKIQKPWKEDTSITTRDEANLLLPILQKKGIKQAYIVTDSWHMPRTMYAFSSVFQNTGIRIIPAPIGNQISRDGITLFDFLPSLGALNTSCIVMHEYIGILAYHLANIRMRHTT